MVKEMRTMLHRLLVLVIVVFLAASTVWAQGRRASSPDEAAAIAREATGGRVLSVQKNSKNKGGYRVKVLKNGRVRTIRIKGK